MRDGQLPLEIGVEHPQFGEDPVLGAVTWGPDGIVGSRMLLELDRQRNQVAIATHVKENERCCHVAVIGVTVNGRRVLQQPVVHQIHVAALTMHKNTP